MYTHKLCTCDEEEKKILATPKKIDKKFFLLVLFFGKTNFPVPLVEHSHIDEVHIEFGNCSLLVSSVVKNVEKIKITNDGL